MCRQGRLQRERANNGDEHAAVRLVNLLVERDDIAGLHTFADTGDEHARQRLALLAERGDVESLRERADTGDEDAAEYLVDVLGLTVDGFPADPP